MPIYKRCGRCGKRLLSGTKCECIKQRHKDYDKYSRDFRSKEFYHSAEWGKKRVDIFGLDSGIDVYVYMTTGEILPADTVHHIISLKEDWDKRLDDENLMSINHSTHSMIEQIYKKNKREIQKQLKEMLIQFRRLNAAGGI